MPRNPEPSNTPRLRLRVTATAETILRGGHPWLFAESIREQNRAGKLGELAVVYDRRDRFLAIGLFDPESPLRVRVLQAGKPATIDGEWWRAHLRAALSRRDGLFDEQTTAYRWINGESDGWPGLVLDRYDATLVLKLYTAAWLPRLTEILALLGGEMSGRRIVLRLSRNIQALAQGQFNITDGQVLSGTPLLEPVLFLETGLRFEADVLRGQKTGFFLDQRENRRLVGSLASGCSVLNAFSYSGGFSLYAARGGAHSVTDLEISAHALESARRNFALNGGNAKIAGCHHELVQADAFEWFKSQRMRKFDCIVLDPPSLAKRESERAGAIAAYARLARSAIGCLRERRVLVAASCSAHVSAAEFFETLRGVARESGRKFEEFRTTGHPPDHPATLSEAHYLKCIYLRCRL